MECPNCKTPIDSAATVCPNCGIDPSAAGTVPLEHSGEEPTVTDSAQIATMQIQLQRIVGDQYEIIRSLGRGGMGAVFLAKERKLDRLVAIKVLPPSLSFDEQFTQRFVREARTAAKLDHPSVVPIYSVEDEGELLFFVMKYVRGMDLGSLLRAQPPAIRKVQKILWESACALGHAHQRGVIHRDVKPGNIMIDEAGRAVLTDFGIAKAVRTDTQYTATGQMIGTPTYISPEQAKGITVDGRSDQYSLGIVGYQMICGKVPFEDASFHSLIYKQLFQDPPPLKTVRPDCPDFLAEAVHRALQKEPKDRFDTMEEFATAVLPEEPVQAAAAPQLENIVVHSDGEVSGPRDATFGAGTRRKTLKRPLAGAGVLAALIGLAGAGWFLISQLTNPSAPAAVEDSSSAIAQGVLDTSTTPTTVTEPETVSVELSDQPASAPAPQRANEPAVPVRDNPATPPPVNPPAVGYLTVGATPVWGTVYIDGVEIRNSPLTRHQLAPGQYVVEVRRAGYETQSDTVLVEAGNTTTTRFIMRPSGQ